MKIGIVIDRMNIGGVEKIALEEVRALRSIGQDAVLVILRRKGVVDDAFMDLRQGIPVIYLDDRMPGFMKFSFRFPVFYFFSFFHITYPWFIPWFVKRHEFDYLVSHGTYTTFTTMMIKKIKKIPYSTYIWDPIGYILQRVYAKQLKFFLKPLLGLARFLDANIIKNADAVLVGGAAHNSYIKELNPAAKIISIPPSIHLPPVIKAKKKDYILMVTAWKRGKNPEYIFKLLEKLPTAHIKLAGRWLEKEYEAEFKDAVVRQDYENRIEVIGEVTEEELLALYREAIVVLQTNDDRGFGLPALEGAAAGTTFIIPTGQGVCELFTEGVDGFFVAEHDTKTIVELLTRLIQSPETAAMMGRHAEEVVHSNYSWEKHAEFIVEVVKQAHG